MVHGDQARSMISSHTEALVLRHLKFQRLLGGRGESISRLRIWVAGRSMWLIEVTSRLIKVRLTSPRRIAA